MTTNLKPGVHEVTPKEYRFVDIELPNHENKLVKLGDFTQPSLMDRHMGFTDGYPLIVMFYRGFFCPRDAKGDYFVVSPAIFAVSTISK